MSSIPQDDAQPLCGLRVIDLTQVVLGPCCTQMLADYGADVVKIERPGTGDLLRTSFPEDPDGLNNPAFRSVNRNKRSIVLDLRLAEARDVVLRLVSTADVVVSNFRPGVLERLELDHDALARINPKIISATGSGFGARGPLSHKGGQDILAQALSGIMDRTAHPSQPKTIFATSICDYAAGMHLVQGILLALLHREKTGRGQLVRVSLLESTLHMQVQEAAMWLSRTQELNWAARPLTDVFRTCDGSIVVVGAFKTEPLRDICRALDMPDLASDERFATFERMQNNKAELHQLLQARFVLDTTDYCLGRLEEQDILCAPLLSLGEALAHEQTDSNGSVIALPDGTRTLAPPIQMAENAFKLRHLPPRLGESGIEVLREAGYSEVEIDALMRQEVLGG